MGALGLAKLLRRWAPTYGSPLWLGTRNYNTSATFILISHGRVIWRDPPICIIASATRACACCCIKLNNRSASKTQQPQFVGNYSLPQNSTYANYPTVTISYYRHCYCRHYCRRHCRRPGRRDPGSPPPSDKPNTIHPGLLRQILPRLLEQDVFGSSEEAGNPGSRVRRDHATTFFAAAS